MKKNLTTSLKENEMYNLFLMEQFARDILHLNSMQRARHVLGVLFLYQ